ncbi:MULTISPECIES: YwqG family protein [Neobacillus]|uniref:DUF1963 domain-containing protein n=1 Tax=Neobacillus rhizophilus TaxID=2833579 RepID=A0A942YUH5_9BACI|nr:MULTISPECIES: YwqG family protein [Neobacillus]MBS4214018.1 DUF1963 domain-containing protein [Neobacillus rhizophilus]
MQHIDNLLREHELYHKKADIISALKNSIKIEKIKVNQEYIPIGSSKLGGLPDMPDEMEFPKYDNGYLTFIGQFKLKEMKPYDKDGLLPNSGILYLFYDVVEQPWGFEEEEGCFKVLYFDGDLATLKRKEYPEISDNYYPLNAYQVNFKNISTISENPANLTFENEDEEENFWNFRQELMELEDEEGNTSPSHYMLGEPFNVQNDVFEELYNDEKEPILLFQIDSDEEDLGVMWGDCGLLYFCIDKEELANKQFDKVRFTLQCF